MLTGFERRKLAAALYFLYPGLGYGIFTSRIPTLAAQTQTSEAELGVILLAVGASALAALTISAYAAQRWGSKRLLVACAVLLGASLALTSLASTSLTLGAVCMLLGFFVGMADACANTQGVLLERCGRKRAMTFLHGMYSLGGVAGALSGTLALSLGVGTGVHVITVFALYLCLAPSVSVWLFALPEEKALSEAGRGSRQKDKASTAESVHRLVVVFGVMAACAYAAEGSVGEWGSLLLLTEKGASPATASLVYALFSAVTVSVRLTGDRVRSRFGERRILCWGAALAFAGMCQVLAGSGAAAALAGYGIMAAGLSPVVPVLFSLAGMHMNPARAAGIVASFAYGGLLLFPPVIGFAAGALGLQKALCAVPVLCLTVFAGSWLAGRR